MTNILRKLQGRRVPEAVKSVLTSSDRVFEFLEVAEERFLVVTMQALTEVESGQVKSRFGWDEVSHARWDSEAGTLRIVFHEGEDLVLTPIEAPKHNFMDIIREALSEAQVFVTPLELPSGQRVSAQILRDDNRNLRLHPPIASFENPGDQQYLRSIAAEWEQKLGIVLDLED
ncbi:MAG: hypothetical protein E6167_01740 [Varibaculum cambriense]|uniref:Uncharacterized protein n=1 Tax=Varibaculum cambriense TaxID=184870 RepID=A0ABX4UNL9_9ACTO|nr:hypothetical protein [Varibaculum cambriense]MDU5268713.1 hypothetical protein [Varibaculum cambriense]MDU5307580.1 hypothetical protein [Varibaculum cambriense]MDU5316474.1 hypothetical protein [Varibaculum cambriense]MDU6681404.1 hypothetical protein [Varibaculum cambriense]MDU7408174.1 hypothetical protein [Varibaculum cambriense]